MLDRQKYIKKPPYQIKEPLPNIFSLIMSNKGHFKLISCRNGLSFSIIRQWVLERKGITDE